MSLSGQATLSTENIKLIINALANYAKATGVDLSKNPFATNLKQFESPDDILQLLEERQKVFREYRDENRKLINCLRLIVIVFHRFSGILGKAVSLVSCTCHLVSLLMLSCQIYFPPAGALFAVINTLLGVHPLNIPFKMFPHYLIRVF